VFRLWKLVLVMDTTAGEIPLLSGTLETAAREELGDWRNLQVEVSRRMRDVKDEFKHNLRVPG